MKHSIDLSLTYGCIRTEMFPQGLELQRLVPDMMNYCNDHGPREIRARCPSGIQIQFNTNALFIRLPYTFGPTARQIFQFDVLCDDAPFKFTDKDRMLEIKLDGAPHKIAILPPHLVQCWFGDLETNDGATLTPVEKSTKTLLFLGDSIMQGMTVSRPTLCYALRLAKAKKANAYNLSVGGMMAERELGKFAMQYVWDELFLSLGTNDFAHDRPLEEYINNMDTILQDVTATDKIVTVISSPYLLSIQETNPSGVKFCIFRNALEKMIREKYPQVRFIDGTTLLPYDEQYYIDQIHPNDLGEDLLFKNLTEQLAK